jgi:hypothetical protein
MVASNPRVSPAAFGHKSTRDRHPNYDCRIRCDLGQARARGCRDGIWRHGGEEHTTENVSELAHGGTRVRGRSIFVHYDGQEVHLISLPFSPCSWSTNHRAVVSKDAHCTKLRYGHIRCDNKLLRTIIPRNDGAFKAQRTTGRGTGIIAPSPSR